MKNLEGIIWITAVGVASSDFERILDAELAVFRRDLIKRREEIMAKSKEYTGEAADRNESKEQHPDTDDVKGCAHYAVQPDEVKGAAGNMQSAEEARKL